MINILVLFLGNLATQAIGIPFSTATLWPLMFVVPFIINLLCMATFWVMHESPQYLLFFKNDKEKVTILNINQRYHVYIS